MSGLYPERRFAGFGPSRLDPEPAPLTVVAGKSVRTLRTRVRRLCPRQAGVYGMLDRAGKLIYIGKAKSLRQRLLSYFRAGSRGEKAGRIIQRTRAVVWEPASGEFAALLRELELIRRWRPKYNVQGQPGMRRTCYVCLGRKPAPYLFVTRTPPAGVVGVYGPLQSAGRAGDAVRRLNDLFRLRDCDRSTKMHFADQPDLFAVERGAGCLRAEIGTCSAPCAGGVSRAGYARQTRTARAFLDGNDDTVVRKLEREMANAASAQAYERAAAVRDKLDDVKWLAERLAWLQRARSEFTFVVPFAGEDGRAIWYLIHRGRVLRGIAAPRNPATRRAARDALVECFAASDDSAPLPADQIDSVLLVAAWFKKHPDDRVRAMSPERALELCRPTNAVAKV